MASKKEIAERRNIIKEFIAPKDNRPTIQPTRQNIIEYINGIELYQDISETTINRDLGAINAKCNKKDSVYYIKKDKIIKNLEIRIKNLLNKCTLYQPLTLAIPIEPSINDTLNEPITLFSVLIVLNKDNNFTIDTLHSEILHLHTLYSTSKIYPTTNPPYLYINKQPTCIQYVFKDKKSLFAFYNKLVEIQQISK